MCQSAEPGSRCDGMPPARLQLKHTRDTLQHAKKTPTICSSQQTNGTRLRTHKSATATPNPRHPPDEKELPPPSRYVSTVMATAPLTSRHPPAYSNAITKLACGV